MTRVPYLRLQALKQPPMRRLLSPLILLSAISANLSACHSNEATSGDPGLAAFNKDSLSAAIRILASDSFQGRRPFTAGEAQTIDYLVNSYKSLGLEPGNGNSYTQDVPMVEISPAAPPTLQLISKKGTTGFRNLSDFVLWTERPDSANTIERNDLVFAGFGIVAPEYNWNDYAGLDVKGKTVLVMVSDPGFYDSTLFKGHTMTYYGRWTYKYEEAARQGAKACLIIHSTAPASYPFQVVQSSNGGVKLHLDTRNSASYQLTIQGWITSETANKFLAAAGKDGSLLLAAQRRGFRAVPLNTKVSASVSVKEVYNMSHNVIAKITGSKYPDEYVIYSAHWDHFGIGKPDTKGDSIYNGALDNASGSAALLQIAKAFESLPSKPERTVVFLPVTAEEQGLLGSAWYAQHPVYPLAKTVANLNIDGLNNFGPTKDISYSGKGQSELEDYLAAEAKKNNRYISPEDHPEAGHYFRSDHFNFARAGVPSLTVNDGVDDPVRGTAYGKKKHDEYVAERYHQPADQIDSTWDLTGGLQDVELVYAIGEKLADSRAWPEWKPGSEFKAVRDKSAAERK
jgi:Zn-dependent M28 family amino/carboxypeptidase